MGATASLDPTPNTNPTLVHLNHKETVSMNATQRLHDLLAQHEQIAQSIRTTLGLLNGGNGAATNGHARVARAALTHAVTTRGRKRRKPRKPVAPVPAVTAVAGGKLKARRERSAELLGLFSTDEVRPSGGIIGGKIGPLVRGGYLRKKSGGYLRTTKEYTV
jgi:hypothetical protein